MFGSSDDFPRWPQRSEPCGGLLFGLAAAILCAAVVGCRSDRARAPAGDEKDRTVMSHALPRMDGGHLSVTVVEVTYGPGGSSPPHSHPCPVIGYVVEGAYRTQVKGAPEAIYRAGETFNVAVTESLSALVTYNGEHYNSIFSLSRGRYTGSLLFVSGGDIGAAWNITW